MRIDQRVHIDGGRRGGERDHVERAADRLQQAHLRHPANGGGDRPRCLGATMIIT